MLKKLKALFIVEEEGANAQNPGNNKKAASNPSPARPGKKSSSRTTVTADGKVSDKFLQVLLGAMENNNLDGFDYLEYKDFLRSLDKVAMEESMRYKSAFATAQTMGATLTNIKESAQHYIDILNGEKSKFESAVEKRREQVLQLQKDNIVALEESVKEKLAEIDKLKKEIETANENIARKREEFASSEAKVESTNADFVRTYNVLVEQIQHDLNKINAYLS